MRIWGCSIAALAVGMTPSAAFAQTTGAGQQAPQEAAPAIGVVPEPAPLAPKPSATGVQTTPTGGSAQVATAADVEAAAADDGGDIVVTGQLEGAVQGNPRPELQLDPATISSYSATTVAELLDQVSAQLGTDQPPVILLAGRRSSIAEVNSLPKEAIGRMDILSEDVALRLGYSANQKVVNIVLRRSRFYTAQFDGQAPTEGGVGAGRVSENLTEIFSQRRRLVLNGTYQETSSLFESERGVSRESGGIAYDLRGNIVPATGTEIDPALSAAAGSPVTIAGVPEAAAAGRQPLSAYAANANKANVTDNRLFRTLSGPQRQLELNASYAHELSDSIDGTLTMEYQARESRGWQGLPNLSLTLPAGNPFSPFSSNVRVLRYYDGIGPQQSSNRSQNFNIEGRLSGQAPWGGANGRWTLEANVVRGTSQSWNDRGIDVAPLQALLNAGSATANPFAPLQPGFFTLRPDDTTKSRNTNISVNATTNGTLFALPAGNANFSVVANGRFDHQTSDTMRAGVPNAIEIDRNSGSLRANIDVPISSTSLDVLSAIGDLSLNGNVAAEQVKFGTLWSTGYGFRWTTPIKAIVANVSWSNDQNAPSANALGAPITITPNVRAFDYVRGESVDITRITGGNPNLVGQESHNFNLRLNIRPVTITQGQLNFTASYQNRRSRNDIQGLPAISAEVEAAFPERFTRDASGRLVALDARQINISAQNYKELRFGLNFSKTLPSPSTQRMMEQRQKEAAAFRAALEESRRTGQPLPPEFTARMEEMRRQQAQQSIFGNRGPGQNRGAGQGQGQGQGQNQQGQNAQGQNQQGQAQQNQGQQGQGQGGGRFGGGGFGGGGFGGGGRGGGGGGGFGGRGGGGGGNAVRFNLTYVRVLEDEQVIRPGLPVLDALNGAPGNRNVFNNSFGDISRWGLTNRGGFGRGGGGGTSRDNVQATAAINYESYLLQLDTSWVSSTFVNTGALGSTTRLDYASFAKVNLTTQINFDRQFNTIRKIPFLRGASVIFNVDNLFNARRKVTDQNGVTPANQDPRLSDPIGRLLRLSFRKQFR